jgi:hypothetical protein
MDFFSVFVVVGIFLLLATRDEPRRRIAGRPLVPTRDLYRD